MVVQLLGHRADRRHQPQAGGEVREAEARVQAVEEEPPVVQPLGLGDLQRSQRLAVGHGSTAWPIGPGFHGDLPPEPVGVAEVAGVPAPLPALDAGCTGSAPAGRAVSRIASTSASVGRCGPA